MNAQAHFALVLTTLIASAAFSGAPALAHMGDDGGRYVASERAKPTTPATDDVTEGGIKVILKMSGSLLCSRKGPQKQAGENPTCKIAFTEARTGRVYQLANAEEAVRLYKEGTRQVVIEGSFTDGDTLNVARIDSD